MYASSSLSNAEADLGGDLPRPPLPRPPRAAPLPLPLPLTATRSQEAPKAPPRGTTTRPPRGPPCVKIQYQVTAKEINERSPFL